MNSVTKISPINSKDIIHYIILFRNTPDNAWNNNAHSSIATPRYTFIYSKDRVTIKTQVADVIY